MLNVNLDMGARLALEESTDARLDGVKLQLSTHRDSVKIQTQTLRDLVAEIEDDACLSAYAAGAALKVLVENWEAALFEGGYYIHDLAVNDLTSIRNYLDEFEQKVKEL